MWNLKSHITLDYKTTRAPSLSALLYRVFRSCMCKKKDSIYDLELNYDILSMIYAFIS